MLNALLGLSTGYCVRICRSLKIWISYHSYVMYQILNLYSPMTRPCELECPIISIQTKRKLCISSDANPVVSHYVEPNGHSASYAGLRDVMQDSFITVGTYANPNHSTYSVIALFSNDIQKSRTELCGRSV